MSELEKMELADRIKAMDEDEKNIAIKMFSTDLLFDELRRREQIERQMLHDIRTTLKIEE